MSDVERAEHEIDSIADLPMQPTGNGLTDMEIAKLEAAIEEGAADESIEIPIPDDEPTVGPA